MNLATRPALRASFSLLESATAALILFLAVLTAIRLFPDNYFYFHASWLLHPFEQEHLMIARNLVHEGGLTIGGEGLDPAYGSEDRGYIDGRYVPRGMLLTYLVYALPFLVSDSAWLYVTPLFALLAAAGVGIIVHWRTASQLAGLGAAAMLYFSSPFLLASSGLAYETLIACTFVIWGFLALEAFHRRLHPANAAAAGLLFGCAAGVRADYAPVTLLFILYLGGWLLWLRWRFHNVPPRILLGCAAAVIITAAAIGSILLTNYAITGSPLRTAYGEAAWQGSATGVAKVVTDIDLEDFLRLTRLFLWDIGRPETVIFLVGLVIIILHRKFHLSDSILIGLALFLVVLHLGRSGLHATDTAFLVSSPPRYLLPVYAMAVVVGFSALGEIASRLGRGTLLGPSVLLSVAIIAVAAGVGEAYTDRGIIDADSNTRRLRIVHKFSLSYPDALFVGDLDTKAIIITQRLLIPRLVDDLERVSAIVGRELDQGRRVFIVDDRRLLINHPLYSGYFQSLESKGFIICQLTDGRPAFSEVLSEGNGGLGRPTAVQVLADNREPVRGPVLEAGKTYYLMVTGQFQFDSSGALSDGVDLWVDGKRIAASRTGDHRYCIKLEGKGTAVGLVVHETYYEDNQGHLNALFFRAD